jgi:superfamily II DNA or RNA helicase
MQAPTGAGQTIMATSLINAMVAAGLRSIFCVSSLSLIDQTVTRLEEEGIFDIGIVQGDHPRANPRALVQICSIQTMRRRGARRRRPYRLETHVWHDAYETWVRDPAWARVPFIGLTATSWRKGLGLFFDKLIKVSSTDDLIKGASLPRAASLPRRTPTYRASRRWPALITSASSRRGCRTSS